MNQRMSFLHSHFRRSFKGFKIFEEPKALESYENASGIQLFLSKEVFVARIFSVQYLNVSYIARGCPFRIHIGESSQNSKYAITSDVGFISARRRGSGGGGFILDLQYYDVSVLWVIFTKPDLPWQSNISSIHKTVCYISHRYFTYDFVQRETQNKIKIVVDYS